MMFFLGEICPAYANVDRALAKKLSLAFAEIGSNSVGSKKFSTIFKKELDRRANEIKATGPQMWCNYQKPNMKEIGANIFID
ncbi:hypothetical protein [Methylobacterium isbiliense]|uniref:hypothetical protein n=1 Tax=Methylobacterium isbiliense TaxID=315478 RepID=UPI001EE39BB2|nr:hypothetical protein [Methylobacterium isbiliense]MDN3627239.1 hypothetical protein [Methylobacterium isbiliense]